MRKWGIVSLMILGVAGYVRAQESNILARFDGAIGVSPIANVAQPPNADGTFANVVRNVVRGVDPAGPWTIAGLKAVVTADGRIRIKGRGLLLAAGNRIGQTANQRVFATLICEPAAPFVQRSSAAEGVALEANGDFRIDDTLTPLPAGCASPVLLIRSASLGAWFAAAIPRVGDDE
jgi:hypothetical protein